MKSAKIQGIALLIAGFSAAVGLGSKNNLSNDRKYSSYIEPEYFFRNLSTANVWAIVYQVSSAMFLLSLLVGVILEIRIRKSRR